MIEFEVDEWMKEGERRFGKDYTDWKFVCPICGNVACMEDFKPFKDEGAIPDSVTQVCIGRFYPKDKRYAMSPEHGIVGTGSPCDYSANGLFRFAPVRVFFKDGKVREVFAFEGMEV